MTQHRAPHERHRLSGIITLVQERRFQLVDEHGIAHLFVLAGDAGADPRALRDLAHTQARVVVSYRDSPSSLVAHVATGIDAAPERIPE